MARTASITQSHSTLAQSDWALLGWLLILTVLIAAALFVEEDMTTEAPSLGTHSVSAAPLTSEPCQGDDLRARMCKIATEGGLTAGIQY
jgi:hypothetical protein